MKRQMVDGSYHDLGPGWGRPRGVKMRNGRRSIKMSALSTGSRVDLQNRVGRYARVRVV